LHWQLTSADFLASCAFILPVVFTYSYVAKIIFKNDRTQEVKHPFYFSKAPFSFALATLVLCFKLISIQEPATIAQLLLRFD
jgi:hypothetical protein